MTNFFFLKVEDYKIPKNYTPLLHDYAKQYVFFYIYLCDRLR